MTRLDHIKYLAVGDKRVAALHIGHTKVWSGVPVYTFIASQGNWSDMNNWAPQMVPPEGSEVHLPDNVHVILDQSTAVLERVEIMTDATLTFLDNHSEDELVLRAKAIHVAGSLLVGSEQQPYVSHAAIELLGPAQVEGDTTTLKGVTGHKALTLMNGTLRMYGTLVGLPRAHLNQTAVAGATVIVVDSAAGWSVGERIVVTSTDYYVSAADDSDIQVEEFTVTAINGTSVTLDGPLAYTHYGVIETYDDASGVPRALDSRAEVVRLNRNIVVRSEDETTDSSSDRYRYGGQIMGMGLSTIILDAVEVTRMGQHGILLRYPIHFHVMRENGAGSKISRSSVHNVYNRGITIHSTNNVVIEDNSVYRTFGHCYFFEDGAEEHNTLSGNIAIQVMRPSQDKAILLSDRSSGLGPTGYWITNPNNTIVNNTATSVRGTGFWYALPLHPTGSFAHFYPEEAQMMFPRNTPLGVFRGNIAHSIAGDGLHVDKGPQQNSSNIETTSYRPRSDPTDAGSLPVTATFEDFTAWKVNDLSIWLRGDNHTVQGGILADHSRGLTMANSASTATDIVFVGETANIGTPMTPREIDTGRSMPRSNDDPASNNLNGYAYPIFGFAFYDGDVHIRDSSFYNYQQNQNRYASALGIHDWTNFSYSQYNDAENLHFSSGTLRYWRSPVSPSKVGSLDGFRSATILDNDGSITGTPGAVIVPSDNQLLNRGAIQRPEWGAAIRTDLQLARLYFINQDASVVAPLQYITLTNTLNDQFMLAAAGTDSATPGNAPATNVPAYGEDYRVSYTGVLSNNLRLSLGGFPDEFDATNLESLRPTITLRIDYSNNLPTPLIYRDNQTAMQLDPAETLAAFNAQTGTDDQLYYRDTTAGILHVRMCTRTASPTTLRTYAYLNISQPTS